MTESFLERTAWKTTRERLPETPWSMAARLAPLAAQ